MSMSGNSESTNTGHDRLSTSANAQSRREMETAQVQEQVDRWEKEEEETGGPGCVGVRTAVEDVM
jgi:hypothetical protein